MAKNEWSFQGAKGKARGTQGWNVENEKLGCFTYTGLWRGNKVVAVLVSKGFDEGKDSVEANGELITVRLNNYPTALDLLRRLGDAVEALDGTSVENGKLVDDYRAFMSM